MRDVWIKGLLIYGLLAPYGVVGGEALAAGKPVKPGASKATKDTSKGKKRSKGSVRVRYYKRKKGKQRKIPPMTRQAALELERWFAPLSRKKGKTAGTGTLTRILRTWIASRWGMRMKRSAWKNWADIREALRMWNPAPLYHKMKKKWDKTWVVGKQRKNRIYFTLPKVASYRPKGVGRAAMGVKLSPLKRMPSHKRRPYLFTLSSYADIPPINIKKLDELLKSVIDRVATPSLNVPLAAGQKPLFKELKPDHSRKVANWLTSRFPITSHLLDRYLVVASIMKSMGGGLYKVDLQAKWRMSSLRKDYPALAKKMAKRHKNRAYVEIVFRDNRNRQWLKWSYHRVKMTHRFEAVIGKGGLMLCDSNWRPQGGPWRPTQMGSEWITAARVRLQSQQVKIKVNKILFKWEVKPLKRGASLSIEMMRSPVFRVQGGEFLRLLARILIPGGVERMARWFLKNLATGNQGKGVKWRWDLVEHQRYARVLLTFAFPMVTSRTLTSILRLLPAVIRQQRSKGKRKTAAKRKRKRRRRRTFGPLWRRLYHSIRLDISNARKLLARR